jgi:gliding motility-associated-like protein
MIAIDESSPIITNCLIDTSLTVDNACQAVVPDFTTSTSLQVTDNCGSISSGEIIITQLPLPGTIISNDTIVQIFATDGSGNVSFCSFKIELQGCEIIVLESLSPNNDGKNDYFYVSNIDKFPGTTVHIYNRWGSEVYYSDDYKNSWNGTSQLPEGTYYYLLELGGMESNASYGKLYKGYLYIKR